MTTRITKDSNDLGVTVVANGLQPTCQEAHVNRVLLVCGVLTVALSSAAAANAQAPGAVGVAPSDRHAVDRRVDESSRQTQAARQTEASKPAEPPAPAKADPKPAPAFQRQAEPQRQAASQRQPEPQRQHESHRQAEPSRQNNNTGHWDDPGPAWRPQGPAWRNLNDRPNVPRPVEDAFRASPKTYAPRDRKGGSNTYYGYPYGLPYGFAPYVEYVTEPAPEPAARQVDEPALGFFQLRVQPRTAEVYVDGVLAGTVDDFGGRGARQLTAGPHRVEILAPGYETLTFDVRVPENDTVTFTHELDRAVPRPAPVAVVIPHKALYVVPQCYIGDRMPLPTDMPAGCRVEDVRVIP